MENLQLIAVSLAILVPLSLYIYAVIDVNKRKDLNYKERAKWVNILYFTGPVGMLVYLYHFKWRKSREPFQL